jgi:hypothetical protein
MSDFGALIQNETSGEASFVVEIGSPALDGNVREAPILYRLIGESRFRLVRNNKFELIFVHLTEDWMRQAKVDLNGVDLSRGLNIRLTWTEEEDTLAVKGAGEAQYRTAVAVQMDN